jgi:hypothetical protein
MSLPLNLDYWKHLKNTIRYYHNQQVNNYFKKTPKDNIQSPKASLRVACTIRPQDTVAMVQLRLWLFEVTVGHAQSLHPVIAGVPMEEFQRESKFSPQVKIYFKETFDIKKHIDGRLQKQGEMSFRVIGETAQTMTEAKAKIIANRIKDEFFTPLITWKKGKFKCKYLDLENGFDFRVFAFSKQEGVDMIQRAIKSAGKTYQSENFEFIENTKTFPANPGSHTVYGKQASKPQRRPQVDLRPTHAHLLLNGRVQPVTLVSVGRFRRNALIYV